MSNPKVRSIALIASSQIAVLSTWFIGSAILPDLIASGPIEPFFAAAMASAVQFGFVTGALIAAILGLADRYDPRRVFFISALLAASSTAALLISTPGGAAQVALRFVTGASLAGVYPVGMKIAIGWGQRDRGLLVGLLVGALTVGSSAPHLLAWLGGTDWRLTVAVASALAVLGAFAILGTALGPFHARASAFDPRAIFTAWTHRRVRLAYAGYLGHMWELYAFWAWVGTIASVAFATQMPRADAIEMSKWVAFAAIALGGLASVPAGYWADRIGKAKIAQWAMIGSLSAALASALCFNAPWPMLLIALLLWGLFIVPDSAQFSALVADAAPPERAGSLMTFQTALGFALTIFTVQLTPWVAETIGWPVTLAVLALGPIFGIQAMHRLMHLRSQ